MTNPDQKPITMVSGVLDAVRGAVVPDPWASINAQRQSKHSLVVLDLDIPATSVPVIHPAEDGKEWNVHRDFQFFIGNIIDQLASQVLMFRTNIEAWMTMGPNGMQALVQTTRRLRDLGCPVLLEMPIAGPRQNRQRWLDMFLGIVLADRRRVGFTWVQPQWVQIPITCHRDVVQDLLARGLGVLLDTRWAHTAQALEIMDAYLTHPLVPRSTSGLMPYGFVVPPGVFEPWRADGAEVLKSLRASVPLLLEDAGVDTAGPHIAAAAALQCPMMYSAGNGWTSCWRQAPDGATRWRRIILDHVLNLNTALEQAP